MNERNYAIDVLKFICAALVVFRHTTDWVFRNEFLAFTGCAVPCFFMISGYLLFDVRVCGGGVSPERLKRNFIHVLKIATWATLVFFLWDELRSIIGNHSFYIPNVKKLIDWLLFNENPFAFHLWYLFAYLYVLIIIMVINKHHRWKMLYWITPFLLLADLVFGKYSLILWGREPSASFYVRNFLFVGLPFFAIGTMIKRNIHSILIWANKNRCYKQILLVGGIVLFTITTYLERYWLLWKGLCGAREHYLSNTLLAICIFLFFLSQKDTKRSWFSEIGEKDSLYIYIFHPLFMYICAVIVKKVSLEILETTYLYTAPFVVLITTIIFTKCLRKLKIIK